MKPHYGIESFFLPKECLPDDPWEYADRPAWEKCTDTRVKVHAVIQTVGLIVVLLIILAIMYITGHEFSAKTYLGFGAATVLGLGLIWGLGPWWTRRQAQIYFGQYDQEFSTLKAAAEKEGKPYTRQDYIAYHLQESAVESAAKQAKAAQMLAMAQEVQAGVGAASFISSFMGHKK